MSRSHTHTHIIYIMCVVVRSGVLQCSGAVAWQGELLRHGGFLHLFAFKKEMPKEGDF